MISVRGSAQLAAIEAEARPDPPLPLGATSQRPPKALGLRLLLEQKSEMFDAIDGVLWLTFYQVSFCEGPRATLN